MSIAVPEERVARFVDAQGRVLTELPAFASERASLLALYRAMVLTRVFDAKAVALQRTGRLGTYASSLGQEAVGVGVASAMHAEDVLVPSFREHGAQLVRGVRMVELFQYWGGDERGSAFESAREDFPVCLTVGSQASHAAGVALAFKLRHEPRVAVCVMGDGATSKGDVYEAMNLAGVWKLPVLFVISNNQWAISLPRAHQTAARTLAQKAVAAGFSGEQVDGNDVIAVRTVIEAALERAREGGGPQCIEALTYRLGEHTTADDSRRYRDPAEVDAARKEEPLVRTRALMTERFGWSSAEDEALLAECAAEVDEAARAYAALPPQAPETMFDNLHAALPAAYASQREQVREAKSRG
ncbi:MAG: pyruvate dehydrogenase (acetyl-transferring) E1 component subunit alpha [Polyangiales bacterium]